MLFLKLPFVVRPGLTGSWVIKNVVQIRFGLSPRIIQKIQSPRKCYHLSEVLFRTQKNAIKFVILLKIKSQNHPKKISSPIIFWNFFKLIWSFSLSTFTTMKLWKGCGRMASNPVIMSPKIYKSTFPTYKWPLVRRKNGKCQRLIPESSKVSLRRLGASRDLRSLRQLCCLRSLRSLEAPRPFGTPLMTQKTPFTLAVFSSHSGATV